MTTRAVRATDRGFPDLTPALRAFLRTGLMLDPWLAGLQKENFEFAAQELVADEAARIAAQQWREPLISATLGTSPLPRRLGRTAAHEVLVSTAGTVAHERRGTLHIDKEEAIEAILRLRHFLEAHSFGTLVLVYGLVTFVENHLALEHYGAMSEEDFVEAALHRPWVPYTLDDELLAGLVLGAVRLEVRDGRRCVLETPRGARYARRARRMLERSGYLARRLQLIYLSQFNLFADWDAQVAQMVPNALEYRRAFTAFSGLAPGAKVLEVGCGMASQTFEGGLWEAVGPSGQITGLDPSAGMLARARAKAAQRGAQNVTFVDGRAERMYFRKGEFDATVGVLFLHFTDVAKALRELRRVTKPGGTVAVVAACRWDLAQPWFRRWFAPIFDLAERHGGSVQQHLHEPGAVGDAFAEAGLQDVQTVPYQASLVLQDPDLAVAFLIQGLSFFQRELELLPWQARQDLIATLKREGAKLCAETTPEQRTLATPFEFVKGTVPPA
ncbi:MAG: class I SAM-dependent methyltransferase [Chloroflexota bacterium]